jgi:hypothetical protein
MITDIQITGHTFYAQINVRQILTQGISESQRTQYRDFNWCRRSGVREQENDMSEYRRRKKKKICSGIDDDKRNILTTYRPHKVIMTECIARYMLKLI